MFLVEAFQAPSRFSLTVFTVQYVATQTHSNHLLYRFRASPTLKLGYIHITLQFLSELN